MHRLINLYYIDEQKIDVISVVDKNGVKNISDNSRNQVEISRANPAGCGI
jgi:hypothetical protein